MDLIIYNARIYRPDQETFAGTAIAVRQNTIAAIGSDREIQGLAGPGTRLINAAGRLLLPAFTDSHTHFMGLVRRRMEVRLGQCNSLGEALQEIRKKADQTPEGGWITGGGWNRNIWAAGEFPTRHQLDEISTRHFIALDSKDWHTMWVNTPVLNLADIPLDRPYAGARHLALDPESGEFTGILEENARLIIFDLIPPPNYETLRDGYLKTVCDFRKMGFAAVHSMETPIDFEFFRMARQRNELGLRVFWYAPVKHRELVRELISAPGLDPEWLQVAGLKIFLDGAFGSQTAELFENYSGLGHAGVETLSREDLEEYVKIAVESGLSCAIHAIGDRAVHKCLRVLGHFSAASRRKRLNHRIEHAQLVRPDDLSLFRKFRVTASVQPVHLASDIPIVKKYLGNRAEQVYPLNSLRKAGARLIFGSDTPIEPFNPWWAIYSALERRLDLNPEHPAFAPDERLDLTACLSAYTHLPAQTVGADRALGILQPQMRADFFLSALNVLEVSPDEIKNNSSLLTVIDGKIVHQEIE